MTDIELLPLPEHDEQSIWGENKFDSYTDEALEKHAREVAEHNVKLATAELHRQFGCELQDPNGTIWDHAAKLQAENELLRDAREDLVRQTWHPSVSGWVDTRRSVAALRDHDKEGRNMAAGLPRYV